MVNFQGTGHQIKGWHPGIVISNDVGNRFNSYFQIIPISSAKKKNNLPTHVFLSSDLTGLSKDSWAQCEGMTLVNDKDISCKLCDLDKKHMQMIAIAVSKTTPVLSELSDDDIKELKADICEKLFPFGRSKSA